MVAAVSGVSFGHPRKPSILRKGNVIGRCTAHGCPRCQRRKNREVNRDRRSDSRNRLCLDRIFRGEFCGDLRDRQEVLALSEEVKSQKAGKFARDGGPKTPGDRELPRGGRLKTYPTNAPGRRGSSSAGKKRPLAIAKRSRAIPPEIFVRVPQASDWHPYAYARAHLRNRKGYVYLTWREGQRIRTFYLGKAPRKSPTVDRAGSDGAGAAAAPPAPNLRRGKIRGSR